jgi:hypothetical protein
MLRLGRISLAVREAEISHCAAIVDIPAHMEAFRVEPRFLATVHDEADDAGFLIGFYAG